MTSDQTVDPEMAVLVATQRWLDATMTGDAAALEPLLAEGYTYTHATTGNADSREKWLESFRTGGRRYHVYRVFDLSLRVFPGTVVMTGRAHQEMSPRGERIELNTSFTCVWIEVDSAWRLAAWQATRFVENT